MSRTLRRPATAAQAAEHYGVCLRTVRRWIASGELPSYRIGRKLIRVDLDDVERLAKPVRNA